MHPMEEIDVDKIPVIAADPMEAAQMPIEGVDIPENEGLVKQTARKAPGAVESVDGEELDAATEAAQRGRTA
jgi:hypothetical protein